jgi:ABC-type branched-subunit amino acid transport system substrate-binding protein
MEEDEMDRRLRIARAVAACAFSFAAFATQGADIVIGQVAPLSGVLADTGKDMVLGVSLYVKYINDKGGINGQRIKHVVRDDAYKIDETIKQTKDLLEKERPVALIGFAGTGNVGELLKQKVLADANIALVAPYTGGEPLRNPFNPWIFHIRAGYAEEGERMVAHLVALGITRIAVMYQDDPFGIAGLKGVEAAAQKRGLKLAALGPYEKNTDKVEKAVELIHKADPQAVIMISVNKPTAAFIKQFRAVGGTAQLYNISVINAGEVAKLAGAEAARGTGIAQVMPFPYTRTTHVVSEYLDLLNKYAPEAAPSYTSLEEFIGAKVLVEGLRRAGPNASRERVTKSLETLNDYDTGDFFVSFSPANRIGSHFVEVSVIGKNGRIMH